MRYWRGLLPPARYRVSSISHRWGRSPPVSRTSPGPRQYFWQDEKYWTISHWKQSRLTDLHWACLMRRTQLSVSCGSSASLDWAEAILSGLTAMTLLGLNTEWVLVFWSETFSLSDSLGADPPCWHSNCSPTLCTAASVSLWREN